ncbi:MAG: TspO/MBR family protein [Candidatus Dactylopiibacterium sp.]|nr:TspO/MBR family protein [Candidatus Dactylopiibacterium sp.]
MPHRSPYRRRVALLLWLGAAFIAGGIGALATRDAPAFYAQLVQPAWAPPAGVFGPVWSVLYALMGVAAWLIWQAPRGRAWPLMLFVAQLALNALWSWLFFAWHAGAAAFAEVILLLVLIAATVLAFARVSRAAAALLLPYLAWVGFASALTWALWRANPALLGALPG